VDSIPLRASCFAQAAGALAWSPVRRMCLTRRGCGQTPSLKILCIHEEFRLLIDYFFWITGAAKISEAGANTRIRRAVGRNIVKPLCPFWPHSKGPKPALRDGGRNSTESPPGMGAQDRRRAVR